MLSAAKASEMRGGRNVNVSVKTNGRCTGGRRKHSAPESLGGLVPWVGLIGLEFCTTK